VYRLYILLAITVFFPLISVDLLTQFPLTDKMVTPIVPELNASMPVQAVNEAFGQMDAGTLEAALEAARARFVLRNPTSLKLHQEALNRLPGGNTRSLLYTAPFPIYIKSGSEHRVFDEDGHE